MKQLERFTEDAYALLRIVTGFTFAFHGAQKILLAALYCFVFLFIACNGVGTWSIDPKH